MHKPMPRLFLASPVAPTAAMRDVMADLQTFDRALRVVRTAPLHVTYRFLGQVESALIPDLSKALSRGLGGVPCGTVPWHGPFVWPLRAAAPQRLHRARLVALMADPTAAQRVLEPIADAIDRALDGQAELPPRDRPFEAHVTLARFRRRLRPHATRDLAAWLQHQPATRLSETLIDTVELIESDLTPQGPRYTLRHRVALR